MRIKSKPSRNSGRALNPAGIIIKPNLVVEQRGIISNVAAVQWVDIPVDHRNRIHGLKAAGRFELDFYGTWVQSINQMMKGGDSYET